MACPINNQCVMAIPDSEHAFDPLHEDIGKTINKDKILCNAGYIFNGEQLTCNKNGQWLKSPKDNCALNTNKWECDKEINLKQHCKWAKDKVECAKKINLRHHCKWAKDKCIYKKGIQEIISPKNPICKPLYCPPKVIKHSDRSQTPLPGAKEGIKGKCSINGKVIPHINDPIDCSCYTHKSCYNCTKNRDCNWCKGDYDNDGQKEKGSAGCYSKSTTLPCKRNKNSNKVTQVGYGSCTPVLTTSFDSASNYHPNPQKDNGNKIMRSITDCETNRKCIHKINKTLLTKKNIKNLQTQYLKNMKGADGTPSSLYKSLPGNVQDKYEYDKVPDKGKGNFCELNNNTWIKGELGSNNCYYFNNYVSKKKELSRPQSFKVVNKKISIAPKNIFSDNKIHWSYGAKDYNDGVYIDDKPGKKCLLCSDGSKSVLGKNCAKGFTKINENKFQVSKVIYDGKNIDLHAKIGKSLIPVEIDEKAADNCQLTYIKHGYSYNNIHNLYKDKCASISGSNAALRCNNGKIIDCDQHTDKLANENACRRETGKLCKIGKEYFNIDPDGYGADESQFYSNCIKKVKSYTECNNTPFKFNITAKPYYYHKGPSSSGRKSKKNTLIYGTCTLPKGAMTEIKCSLLNKTISINSKGVRKKINTNHWGKYCINNKKNISVKHKCELAGHKWNYDGDLGKRCQVKGVSTPDATVCETLNPLINDIIDNLINDKSLSEFHTELKRKKSGALKKDYSSQVGTETDIHRMRAKILLHNIDFDIFKKKFNKATRSDTDVNAILTNLTKNDKFTVTGKDQCIVEVPENIDNPQNICEKWDLNNKDVISDNIFKFSPTNNKSGKICKAGFGKDPKKEIKKDNSLSCLKDNYEFKATHHWSNANYCPTASSEKGDVTTTWSGGNIKLNSKGKIRSECSSSMLSSCNVKCDKGYGGGGKYVCHYNNSAEEVCNKINLYIKRNSVKRGPAKIKCEKYKSCKYTTSNNSCKINPKYKNLPTPKGQLEWQGTECYLLDNTSFAHGTYNLPPLKDIVPSLVRLLLLLSFILFIGIILWKAKLFSGILIFIETLLKNIVLSIGLYIKIPVLALVKFLRYGWKYTKVLGNKIISLKDYEFRKTLYYPTNASP